MQPMQEYISRQKYSIAHLFLNDSTFLQILLPNLVC